MPAIIETDWLYLLQVWMHDPVDKALLISRHESRAHGYQSAALGDPTLAHVRDDSIKSADINASIADRLPMPSPGENYERAVGPEDGPIQIYHPVSAQKLSLKKYDLNSDAVSEIITSIVSTLPPSPKIRFLALWRLLPNELHNRFGADFTRFPADTRVPDHSLIQHADISSGIAAAQQGRHGYAILSVTLGPVQTFIQAARSVRDLWSGSALLSWLIFEGMRPILEDLGPTVFVFPALRQHPLADMWLREIPELINLISLPSDRARKAPSLPNRFVALVPYGRDGRTASVFAKECIRHIRESWKRLSNTVRDSLDSEFSSHDPDWALHWDAQIESFFDVTASICPTNKLSDTQMASLIGGEQDFSRVWKDAHHVREMVKYIPKEDIPGYPQDRAGEWQAQLEVSARMAESQRSIRHIPMVPVASPAGPKCTLLGTYEQVGPATLEESQEFWTSVWHSNNRLRKPDRFCAIALCKRFAAERVLAPTFELEDSDVLFPDTATVAAMDWLNDTTISHTNCKHWSGQWLHQHHADEGDETIPSELWSRIKLAREKGAPPSYYAILVMDADDMGLWLKGEKAPLVREVIHEKLLDYFEHFEPEGLDVKRPVGPALHASISEALNNFASVIVPSIINQFNGTLIYSGGDDVLALLPAQYAVQCALQLRNAFSGENDQTPGWTEIEGRHFLTMGHKATLSAGIAFVHYKKDLRAALQAAREAEKASKAVQGKHRLTLSFIRRSGDHSQCVLPWSLAPWFQDAVDMFKDGLSDRWAYHLRHEIPTLSDTGLPHEAVDSEIRRLIERTDMENPSQAIQGKVPIKDWWSHFCEHESTDDGRLERFTQLCLGASFVARGYDG